jgi:intracellular septation protein A
MDLSRLAAPISMLKLHLQGNLRLPASWWQKMGVFISFYFFLFPFVSFVSLFNSMALGLAVYASQRRLPDATQDSLPVVG